MINLNECKFGDKLKMRNGQMAIYVGKAPNALLHFLVAGNTGRGYVLLYERDDGFVENHISRDFDVVGFWEE